MMELVDHPKFIDFIKSGGRWRVQANVKQVFSNILTAETKIDHDARNVSQIHHLARLFIKKAKLNKYAKHDFSKLREAEDEFLSSNAILEEVFVVNQNIVDEGVREQEQVDDMMEVAHPSKKKKKSYEDSNERWKRALVCSEVKKMEENPGLEDGLLSRLSSRAKKRSMEEQKEDVSTEFFDPLLSCLNLISSADISMNKWDFLRLWIRDFIKRGGDILNLPCSKTLRSSKDKMVPSGLLVTSSSARIPLQSMFMHTAQRLFLRPDMQSQVERLQDGEELEMLWKWGVDGQTGG